MTDPAKIAALAAGLSKAQKRAVLTVGKGFGEHHQGKWWSGSMPTARKLHSLGLIHRPTTLEFPTPLGLAVRNYLKEQANETI